MSPSRHPLALSLILLAAVGVGLPGCSTLAKQFGELTAFTRCQFRLASVSDVSLLGIPLKGKTRVADFNLLDAAKLQRALAGGSLPLKLTLEVEVKNPNASKASLSGMEWTLLLDGGQFAKGRMEKPVTVPPNGGVRPLPLSVTVDLNQTLSGRNFDSMLNLALNIAGEGSKPTRLTMKVKPSVTVAGQGIPYPGTLSVGHTFGGK
jgi:hypothetical protein